MELCPTDLIAQTLTKAIVEHRLQPGAKLAEQKLGDHFGVSRTLVRQALLQMRPDYSDVPERQRGRAFQ